MVRLFKWAFVGAFVLLACWHFWPRSTKRTLTTGYNTVKAATEAGYHEATREEKHE